MLLCLGETCQEDYIEDYIGPGPPSSRFAVVGEITTGEQWQRQYGRLVRL